MKVLIDGVEYIKNPFPSGGADKYEAALNAKAVYTDFPDITIRDYLHKLLVALWEQGEGFSGKRPFGNGGWDWQLRDSLIACGYIPGTIKLDEDGDFLDAEEEEGVEWSQMVTELIKYAFYGPGGEN
jgi:hypothetical protein